MGNLSRRLARIERQTGPSKLEEFADFPEPLTIQAAEREILEIISTVEERMRNGHRRPNPPAEDDPVTLEIRALLAQALAEAENRQPSG
jgi:hypothetical protein